MADTASVRKPPYSPFAVCREILHYYRDRSIEMSPLKLMKLAYIAHGFHLAITDEPLFKDKVEAWPYGPAIRSIYNAISHYRQHPVVFNQFDYTEEEQLDKDARQIVKGVCLAHKNSTPDYMSMITHEKGTPWHKSYNRFILGNIIIPNRLIRKHYLDILNSYEKAKSA